ncbi:hypothetical protein [Sphingomonas oryzagri]|uniref:Uncharacterized protein n=1 Tax=Sphingomonas oryzagri TaxID=3042314 RepID=A0ABT6MYY3_9SPHN|nr:hypothetical protein [Sphingomonas oryzagri]MDH7637698.1 hypothetical protein [Sphingomonas oryzagri]
MKTFGLTSMFILAALLPSAAFASPPVNPDDGKPFPEAAFEVFQLAPGHQEAFIRKLAQWDIVSNAGGQPTTQMFLHEDGEGWDVLLFKPYPKTPVTPAQQAAMDAKAEELHLKTGPAFWLEIRKNVATHSETKAQGPLSAAQWLARLDAWRAAHPDADKDR